MTHEKQMDLHCCKHFVRRSVDHDVERICAETTRNLATLGRTRPIVGRSCAFGKQLRRMPHIGHRHRDVEMHRLPCQQRVSFATATDVVPWQYQ